MLFFKNRIGLVRSGWLLFIASLAVLIMQIVFSIPGFYLYKIFRNSSGHGDLLKDISEYPWIELTINGGGVLGSIMIILLFWKFMNKRSIYDLGFKLNRKQIKEGGFALFLGAFSMTIIFVVMLLFGYVDLNGSLTVPTFSSYTITYFILFVLVGFSEEIFFRGYIMKTMEERYNPKWLIYLVSAIIFSFFHGMNPNVTILGLINIGLVGLLFSYMYDQTKTLWMPIGFHITWNYFQGSVFGFPVSGTDPHGLYNSTVDSTSTSSFITGGSFGPEGGIIATAFIILSLIFTRSYLNNNRH